MSHRLFLVAPASSRHSRKDRLEAGATPSRPPALLLALLLAAGLALSGCVSGMLANLAVTAPNKDHPPRAVRDADYAKRVDALYSQTWRVRVGPPAAELAVAVLEPGNYAFNYQVELKQNDKGRKWLAPKLDWTVPAQPAATAPKGTVLVLHGYRDAKENMLHWAIVLAEFGYRAVLVDLRGHGRSTGDSIAYGAFEAKDLGQVVDDLDRRGLLTGKLGVIGVSYGASTGLLLASRDSRVAAVVALEPFSNAREAVVEFAHGVAPSQAAKISASTFAAAVERAEQQGNFSWADGDVLAAMPRVKAPVLFYHGAKDRWLSPDNSRRLVAKAPPGSNLGILENDDHLLLSMRLAPIAHDVRKWFDRLLAPASVTADGITQ